MPASSTPAALLAADEAEPWADPRDHPVWRALRAGELELAALTALSLSLALLCTGRARYLLAAKASRLDLEDGKSVFADVHRMLTVPAADADAGWVAVLGGLGFGEERLAEARSCPPPQVADLARIVREHQLASAHEAVGVARAFDRHLPGMLDDLADALSAQAHLDPSTLAHLRYQGSRADEVRRRVDELTTRYLVEPFEVFAARLAAREVLWAMAALLEEAVE